MSTLTSSPEYTTFKTAMNVAISNFIKQHPESVKYVKKDDGKSQITLFYGRDRDIDLKKIAEICMNTGNDNDFLIDGVTMNVIHATDSIIVFEGVTATIEAEIKSSDYTILSILTKQVVDFDTAAIVTKVKSDIITPLVINRSTIFESIQRPAGIEVIENKPFEAKERTDLIRGKVIIDADKLNTYLKSLTESGVPDDVPPSSPDSDVGDDSVSSDNTVKDTTIIEAKKALIKIRDAVLEVVRMRAYNKELLIGDLSTKLEAEKLWLERVTETSIVLTYDCSTYSETKKVKEEEVEEGDDDETTEYTLTSDPSYVDSKTYYVSDGADGYREAQDSDFDLTPETTAQMVDVYNETEDPAYDESKTYYVSDGADGYTEAQDSNFTLTPETTAQMVDVYNETTDPAYVDSKTYYVSDGADGYTEAQESDFTVDPDTTDVSFTVGTTYYEKTQEEQQVPTGTNLRSFKGDVTYYEKTQEEQQVPTGTNLRSFKSGTQYYEVASN
jgi:hypothetical protein